MKDKQHSKYIPGTAQLYLATIFFTLAGGILLFPGYFFDLLSFIAGVLGGQSVAFMFQGLKKIPVSI